MTAQMNIEQARFNMIQQQIRTWEVLDQSILSLLAVVKRENFVPLAHRAMAFVDTEVPIGHGQCMLAPKLEARLLQELAVRRHEQILEIGTGSGYFAALLAHKSRQVLTIEIEPELAKLASDNLRRAAISNCKVLTANGSKQLPSDGPYDVIVLSGSVASIPAPLLSQLKIEGRLIAIVGKLPIMAATMVTRVGNADFRTVELFETVAPRLLGFDEPSKFRF